MKIKDFILIIHRCKDMLFNLQNKIIIYSWIGFSSCRTQFFLHYSTWAFNLRTFIHNDNIFNLVHLKQSRLSMYPENFVGYFIIRVLEHNFIYFYRVKLPLWIELKIIYLQQNGNNVKWINFIANSRRRKEAKRI